MVGRSLKIKKWRSKKKFLNFCFFAGCWFCVGESYKIRNFVSVRRLGITSNNGKNIDFWSQTKNI
jgi:hypothetical protein